MSLVEIACRLGKSSYTSHDHKRHIAHVSLLWATTVDMNNHNKVGCLFYRGVQNG